MYLPNEILMDVLKHLGNADLKQVRFVSKLWSLCATEYLFEKLYISPHKINIEVFQCVTQHPTLRHCVKQLVYDGLGFSSETTQFDYFENLWRHTCVMVRKLQGPFDSPDLQINEFIETCRFIPRRESRKRLEAAEESCRGFDFIKEGYRNWQELATYQYECMKSKVFMQILKAGLRNISVAVREEQHKLQTLIRQLTWFGCLQTSSELPRHRSGSLLIRVCNPFHAAPLCWYWGDQLFHSGGSSGCLEFWTLTVALSTTEKHVRNFKLESRVAPVAFDVKHMATERKLLHGIEAFSGLQEFKLSLAGCDGEPCPSRYKNLDGLGRLLDHMKQLRRFELRLPGDYENNIPGPFFEYEQIFPEDGKWPHLTTFVVQNFAIGTKEMINLLITRMPSLRHLSFENIELLDGIWECMIEAMKYGTHLSSFEVVGDVQLFYHGRKDFLSDYDTDAYDDFTYDLTHYVVNGRLDQTLRHPSLLPNQPSEASLEYVRDIFGRYNGLECMEMSIAKLARQIRIVCKTADRQKKMKEILSALKSEKESLISNPALAEDYLNKLQALHTSDDS